MPGGEGVFGDFVLSELKLRPANEEEGSLGYATRRAIIRRGRENRVAPLGMTGAGERTGKREIGGFGFEAPA